MRRLILALALGAAAALSACDDYDDRGAETMPPPVEAEAAPAAEDVAEPVVETEAAADPIPTEAPLPPEQRSSEETVQPESETLFY